MPMIATATTAIAIIRRETRSHAESFEHSDSRRHDAFPACLVGRLELPFEQYDREAASSGFDRDREPRESVRG
jgi:hypothetical protein